MNATNRWTHDLSNTWIAALVFLVSIAVYTITLTPTVPFWDAGEYIATSFILGIPHPPGTPLYVLIGRIFTMLPIGTVAQQVNWLSALASSITILFTYLITVKMTRSVYKPEEGENHKVLSYVAGIVAAFIAAFATTFWDNAIEAEVYAGACAIMTFCIWLIMRWQERLDEGTEDGLLLLITYIVGIGVGIHLQVAIAAWPAVIFVFVCRPHYLKQWNYLGWAIVTLSLGIGINGLTFLWAPFVLVVTLIMWLLSGRLHRLAFFSSVLFILGLSVHFYLMIRSNLNPVINEGAPGNWQALWEMLIRDQYKPGSPFDRKAPVWYQIDHMWLRYMMWNFTLYGSKLTALIPLAIGAVGAVVQFMRDKKQSAITFALFGLLGPGMVFYMNFRQGEVRERDYFFVQNFQFMSIWIGIGSAFVLHWLSKNFGGKKSMTAILGALFVMMALLPLAHNWRSHDRRGYVLAENYAHNMLMGCEEGAILFTNGDNDTFPLWYLQEVEGVRKDVRVVNLSLLNTPWYIKQLRDLDPQLPIVWTDGQIESIYIALEYVIASATAQGRQVRIPTEVSQHWDNESLQYILESLRAIGADPGREVSVREVAVDQIVRENKWQKPIYIATSVPDVMGLGSQLKFEGLVQRAYPQPVKETTDIPRLRKNLYEVFKYEGFVKPGNASPIGDYEDRVYKESGPSRMSMNNHAAGFSRLGVEIIRTGGNPDDALKEMNAAEQIAPGFIGVAIAKGYVLENAERWEEAEAHYRNTADLLPTNWQMRSRRGACLVQLGRFEEAVVDFEHAISLNPDQYEPYNGVLTAYYNLNQPEEGVKAIERWLRRHPEDQRVQGLYQQLLQAIRSGNASPPARDTTGSGDSN